MYYLAIDPGESTGWAKFKDGKPLEFGELSIQDFYRWIDKQRSEPYDCMVGEQYVIRPPEAGGFNHVWGKVPTLRILGALEMVCTVMDIELHYQDSQILTPACARFKLPHPKKRSLPQRNAMSAIIHGRWWWEQRQHG